MKTHEELRKDFNDLRENADKTIRSLLRKYDPVDGEINLKAVKSTFLDDFGNVVVSVGIDSVWAEDGAGESIEGSIDDLDMHSILFTIEVLEQQLE